MEPKNTVYTKAIWSSVPLVLIWDVACIGTVPRKVGIALAMAAASLMRGKCWKDRQSVAFTISGKDRNDIYLKIRSLK